eukprot:2424909-Alexandrium_andersonii.AAC.1
MRRLRLYVRFAKGAQVDKRHRGSLGTPDNFLAEVWAKTRTTTFEAPRSRDPSRPVRALSPMA